MRSRKTRLILVLIVLVVVGVVTYFVVGNHQKSTPASSTSRVKTPLHSQSNQSSSNLSFNKSQFSTTDPTSIWVVVNKKLPLQPPTFVPTDLVTPNVPLRVPGNESMQLRNVTATALEQLFAAAKTANLNLMLSSGYRSYTYQVGLYNGYVQSQGQAVADQQSARPGHSEHQTGLAADVEPASKNCELDQCFAKTPEGLWLVANAYKYGFIIRYPADKVAITGYEYEPWHIRYVGIPLAIEMHDKNIETLEEFFSVPGGDY